MPASRSRILAWSALSGVLWSLAWPEIGGLTWLAFVAWLPLLHAERLHDERVQGCRAFAPYALLAVFIWNLGCAWWFACVSEPFATKAVSIGAPVLVNSGLMLVPWWLKRITHRSFGMPVASVGFIFYWLAFEYLHHDWDLQWPWFSIGNVFGTRPEMIQWYEYTGVSGGTLWVLMVTYGLDRMIASWRSRGAARGIHAALTAVVLCVPWIISVLRSNLYGVDRGKAVEVVVVQPNIDPYTAKFGGTDALVQLDSMLDLAAANVTDSTALVVFPETALQESATVDLLDGALVMNGLWENDLQQARSVQRIAEFQQQHPGTAVLCGMSSDRMLERGAEPPPEARPLGDGRHWYISYNAALWMSAQGSIETYHKSKLVAGVELMPFEKILGPLGELALDLGGTTGSLGQQSERSVLRDGSSGIAIAPAICYESVFGDHMAAHVRNGAELIVVITNDGWWSDSPGYRQHLTFSSIRAIETRRSVVRSANTGISCFVDQRGVIRDPTTWWTADARRGIVHLNRELTFYVRHGSYIGKAAVSLALLMLAASLFRRSRRNTSVK